MYGRRGDSLKNWAEVTYPYIANCLIHTTSTFTYDEMKAYKSLESYNYIISGFVLEVSHLKENDHNLFMGKVKP